MNDALSNSTIIHLEDLLKKIKEVDIRVTRLETGPEEFRITWNKVRK